MYLRQQLWVLLLWLCFVVLSGEWRSYIYIYYLYFYKPSLIICEVHGMPWKWGPASNSGPHGGPAWNGGEESTDNIVIHSKNSGKWRY